MSPVQQLATAITACEAGGGEGLFFEASPLPGLLVEVGSNRIAAANPAAAGFYGYTREEMQGMDLAALCGGQAVVDGPARHLAK